MSFWHHTDKDEGNMPLVMTAARLFKITVEEAQREVDEMRGWCDEKVRSEIEM